MAQNPAAVNLTLPVGRLVQGSLYELDDKDAQGRPRFNKDGTPKTTCFFAVAIPKQPGHTARAANGLDLGWAMTDWGGKLWQVGHVGQPQAGAMRNFAWKIIDGDSTELNQATPPRAWNTYEGFPGHWVVRFSSAYLPRLYTMIGVQSPAELTQKDAIEPGYFVEVNVTAAPNGDAQKPGIYMNANMVCLRAFGPKIVTGVPVEQAGFGAAPLPAGATMTPPAGFNPAPAPAGGVAAPGALPVPGFQAAPTPATPAPPGTAGYSTGQPAPAPNPQFIAAPGHAAPPVPGAAPLPPTPLPPAAPAAPPVGPTMTAKAQGTPYGAFVLQGWTDAQLRAEGYIV